MTTIELINERDNLRRKGIDIIVEPYRCGRLMSRAKAKEKLDVEDFKKQMSDSGIYTTTADSNTIDEAPNAYKPYEEILDLIEPTVEVQFLMKPKMNIKASE